MYASMVNMKHLARLHIAAILMTLLLTATASLSEIERLAERARLRGQLPSPAMCRAIRINAGVTQEELAAAVGVSRQTLIHWERAERRPRLDARERYARALQLLQPNHDGDAA